MPVSPASTKPRPPGRERDHPQEGGGHEGEQDERGPRLGADGAQAGEEGEVVEDPAAGRGEDGGLPARAERRPKEVALAQEPVGKLAHGARAAKRSVEEPFGQGADEAERPVGEEHERPARERDDEDPDPHERRLEEPGVDLACRRGRPGR